MRSDRQLPSRYGVIGSYTGLVLVSAALVELAPVALALVDRSELAHVPAFAVPALALGTLGFLLWRLLRHSGTRSLNLLEGAVVVLASWLVVCLFSAFPFMLAAGLNFTQAVFESVSGWTTTGLSVLDVGRAPRMILLWRSVMQYCGGAGLAIIMLASLVGPSGAGLTEAEGRAQQLVPHVRASAKRVLALYGAYGVLGTAALYAAGMSAFDALNHALAAIATGGFSTRPENMAYWDSAAIEAVVIVLMLAGHVNFVTAYGMLHGRWRAALRSGELRLVAVVVPIAVLLVLALLAGSGAVGPPGRTLRIAVFETISALTGTGFSITTYGRWPAAGLLILILLMSVGGGICSTSGGIKQYRVYLLWKSFQWELARPFRPRSAVIQHYVWRGDAKEFVSEAQLRQAATFAFVYVLALAAGTGSLAAHGLSIQDALFEFASALGTVGLSVGVTRAGAPASLLWTETLGMFLGRLEFTVVFVALAKIARDGWAVRPPVLRRG